MSHISVWNVSIHTIATEQILPHGNVRSYIITTCVLLFRHVRDCFCRHIYVLSKFIRNIFRTVKIVIAYFTCFITIVMCQNFCVSVVNIQ